PRARPGDDGHEDVQAGEILFGGPVERDSGDADGGTSIRPPMRQNAAEPRADDDEDENEKAASVSAPIVRKLLETRTVLVCGPVSDDMARDVMAQLLVLDAQSQTKPIRVFINSPGGAVDAGFAIYDVMRFVKAPVHSVCAGLAASAATVIL